MASRQKMTLAQLTSIVTINMMGAGIIMLPADMAQVGAVSLLSWIITATGSMAIAYGLAQAGLFNHRPGGLAAYAEDAYGRPGYFQVFFLYFLSRAIANVAIAISAIAYLTPFAPWLSSTPIATCAGVTVLLWLTIVANVGGPGVTGRVASVAVWGVILPVGLLSFAGWAWFDAATFAAAWNPQGLSLPTAIGSGLAVTVWAFLGLESAAQNAGAVEHPKRNVPLACLFGTFGAAMIYTLSTTVIQGIVPHADLAGSTAPIGLAYARMFGPPVGSIVMLLAVLACLGSLLGWQFTLAQTGKSAADAGMFPALFGRTNRMGAPIRGMVVVGLVQSVLALTTISPTLSGQFSALVNLAVVTTVLPYIMALSALPMMMTATGVREPRYTFTIAVALVAMMYSTYAVYAAGARAVFAGALVMSVGFAIWGLIAPRLARGTRLTMERAA